MKTIAIYIDTYFNGSGGSQYTRSVLKSLNNLSPDNFALRVICTDKEWEKHLVKFPNLSFIIIKKTSILVKIYQIFIAVGLISFAKSIFNRFDPTRKHLLNQNFDIIIFPSADTIACLIDNDFIGTIHDLMHRYERRFKESGSLFRFLYRENYYKNILLTAKIVLVDSRLGQKHVIDSYKNINSKVCILPYIAPDHYYDSHNLKIKNKSDKDDVDRYIFYPAVFWPHKNHINLIRAIKLLKDQGHQIKLVCAGNKKLEYKNLNKYISENGLAENIIFLGYVSDEEIVRLFENAFAMVMPTFYGPTNIPPIEAILLECPPIVSNNYAMPEQFEDAALYINPYDPKDIANAIESLIIDQKLRAVLIENGKRVKHKFTQDRFQYDLRSILKNFDIIN